MSARQSLATHHLPSNKHDELLDDPLSDLPNAAQQMQVLLETNALLEQMDFGTHCFETYADLVASVSSMSVALYEKLFQFRLETIRRTPQHYKDYVANAQCIVEALSGALLDESFEIEHMTGESLCQGDVASIQQLVHMFQQIYDILYTASDPSMTKATRKTHQTRKKSKATATRTTSAPAVKATKTQQLPVKKRTRRGVAAVVPKPKTVKEELLTTQRYGRFVPVPQRSRLDVGSSQDESEDLAKLEPRGETTYFGGVSSVSGASDSAHGSVHYMEEEGEFAQNFSTFPSHSSPATNTSPSVQQTPESGASKDSAVDGDKKKSTNQQEAEAWMGHDRTGKGQEGEEEVKGTSSQDETPKTRVTPTASPAKKKLATTMKGGRVQAKRMINKSPVAPPRPTSTTANNKRNPTTKEHSGSSQPNGLYPLLPHTTRHDQTSKATIEYQRYKLQLKDHLQDLRHRAFCQRQHVERTYRLGEHAANVERIRTRRFEQELRLQRVARGLQAKQQEEKQLKQTLEHLLVMEKERLHEERKITTRVLSHIQQDHAEREQALEQFYATQLELVKEQTARERQERHVVERAHRMASNQMLRELKQERQHALSQALEHQQQVAQQQQFRRTTRLSQVLNPLPSKKPVDVFYRAAMKARQIRQHKIHV